MADQRWRRAALVFAFALALRALYIVSIRHAFFFEHLQTDPRRYQEWAGAILASQAVFRPPFDEAPAYPYFVALLRASPLAVACAQAVLDALACVCIALVAERLGGRRAGVIGGVM